MAARKINKPPRNEKRRDAARTFFLQKDRGVGDTGKAANAGADQDAGALLRFRRFEFQARVCNRLVGSRDGINDEVVDLALLFRLHPIVGIKFAVGGGTTRNEVRDLACDVGNFEFFDAPGATLSGEQIGPCGFDTAADGSDETHSCDDDTAHELLLMCG